MLTFGSKTSLMEKRATTSRELSSTLSRSRGFATPSPRASRRCCRPSHQTHCQRRVRSRTLLRLLTGFVGKLLPGDRGLVHGPALHDREDRHPLVVGPAGRGRILLTAAGVRTGAAGPSISPGRRGDRYCA